MGENFTAKEPTSMPTFKPDCMPAQ